jgi:hypothetical protein
MAAAGSVASGMAAAEPARVDLSLRERIRFLVSK